MKAYYIYYGCITLVYFIVLYYLFRTKNKEVNKWIAKYYNLAGEKATLAIANEDLVKRIKKREKLISLLYAQRIRYTRSIVWIKTPETDARVLMCKVRDELALDLQKDGAITYKVSENFREDVQETEIKVSGTVRVISK